MRRSLALALLLVSCGRTPKLQPHYVTQRGAAIEHPALAKPAPRAIAVIGQLHGPESVLYDPDQDVYFISNINGGELAADGNGFISRVDANTLAVNLQWLTGLDGPKGMTIVGDTLYVSDVTAVRRFNRRTGAPLGAIPIPGATFINDLTNDGKSVYLSDTGLAMGPGLTFIRTGTDAIWKITGDRATKIASGPALHEPNGVDFYDGALHVVSFGSNELYTISDDGKKTVVATFPGAELDGLVHLADGSLLVSSWKGDAIFRGPKSGPFSPILQSLDAPADIGYDTKRHRLLIPRAFIHQVTVHSVQ